MINIQKARDAHKLIEIATSFLTEADPNTEMSDTWASLDGLADQLEMDILRAQGLV